MTDERPNELDNNDQAWDTLIDDDGNPIFVEDAPPPEPTRKGVLGTAAGSGALIILWAAQQFGIEMELEVAVAIAGLLGAAVAYFHRED